MNVKLQIFSYLDYIVISFSVVTLGERQASDLLLPGLYSYFIFVTLGERQAIASDLLLPGQ